MTDNTSNNKTEGNVNESSELGEMKSEGRDGVMREPQASKLKERFKAGSIPLQTDFADLIDLANVGCKAVGSAEGQSGPANGFTLSAAGRLELKMNPKKGVKVDTDGIAIDLKTISGLTMDTDGIAVKPKPNNGIELNDSEGISIKAGNGISVDKDGVAVKAEANKGLQISGNGISIKTGNGIAINSDGVNVKLASGANNSNGGGGQGSNGATSGGGGGLTLSENGLAIEPGEGIQINAKGVSIKLPANSGLSASEANGLSVVANTNAGISVNSEGIELNKNAWINVMCGLHDANYYAYDSGVAAFFCNYRDGCVAYAYGRGGRHISLNANGIALDSVSPSEVFDITGSQSAVIFIISWSSTKATSGAIFRCIIKNLVDNSYSSHNLTLKIAP